jgi:hypothetical protein
MSEVYDTVKLGLCCRKYVGYTIKQLSTHVSKPNDCYLQVSLPGPGPLVIFDQAYHALEVDVVLCPRVRFSQRAVKSRCDFAAVETISQSDQNMITRVRRLLDVNTRPNRERDYRENREIRSPTLPRSRAAPITVAFPSTLPAISVRPETLHRHRRLPLALPHCPVHPERKGSVVPQLEGISQDSWYNAPTRETIRRTWYECVSIHLQHASFHKFTVHYVSTSSS